MIKLIYLIFAGADLPHQLLQNHKMYLLFQVREDISLYAFATNHKMYLLFQVLDEIEMILIIAV